MSGGGAEAGTAPIQAMLGASYSRYPGDKGGASRKRGGGGDRYRRIRGIGRGILGYGMIKGGNLYDYDKQR